MSVNHAGDFRGQKLDLPLQTITAKHGYGIATPVMAPITVTNTTNSTGAPVNDPIHTATTSGNQMMITPTLAAIDHLMQAQASKTEGCMMCPTVIQYHTEQSEHVRGQDISDPLMTVDASNRHGLAAASLVKYYGSNQHGQNAGDPLHTVTAKEREVLTIWDHRPLTDFWRVGRGYAKKLEAQGLYTMGDVAKCSIGGDE